MEASKAVDIMAEAIARPARNHATFAASVPGALRR